MSYSSLGSQAGSTRVLASQGPVIPPTSSSRRSGPTQNHQPTRPPQKPSHSNPRQKSHQHQQGPSPTPLADAAPQHDDTRRSYPGRRQSGISSTIPGRNARNSDPSALPRFHSSSDENSATNATIRPIAASADDSRRGHTGTANGDAYDTWHYSDGGYLSNENDNNWNAVSYAGGGGGGGRNASWENGDDGDGYEEDGRSDDDDEEITLESHLAKELKELERRYGAAQRTQSSYRTRQDQLDRQAAMRQALYGPRHRDADVRLLALRRAMAAEGAVRRRGRFAADDALPRLSTWHKLPYGLQQIILQERATALYDAAGLPVAAGVRLYGAAPNLLTDITFGVAAQLRGLAGRLGWGVERAAAAVAARPLLAELKPDLLEACAAELAVWLGGSRPLTVLMEQLASEPSLAAHGPRPLLALCRTLQTATALPQSTVLEMVRRHPRLMAVPPGLLPGRVRAARRVVAVAAAGRGSTGSRMVGVEMEAARGAGVGSGGGQDGGGKGGGRGGVFDELPPSLLCCSEAQMRSCLVRLQQLLGLDPPQVAALLATQPALALQSPADLTAAVDFLAVHLPPPPQPPQPQPIPVPPPRSPPFASSSSAAAGRGGPSASPGFGTAGQSQKQMPPAQQHPPPTPTPQQQQHPQQQSTPLPRPQLPPPHVQMLVTRCPDVLLLQPHRAAASLDALTRLMAEAIQMAAEGTGAVMGAGVTGRATGAAGGLTVWATARQAAAAVVHGAPRLLLVRLVATEQGQGGVGLGQGWGRSGAALAPEGAKERQASLLSWVKVVGEAQRKLLINAAALAADSPHWPRPVTAPIQQHPQQEIPGNNSTPSGSGGGGGRGIRGRGGAAGTARGARRGSPYHKGPGERHPGERPGSSSSGKDGDSSSSSMAALMLAAATAGITAVPIDLGFRQDELLQLLRPGLAATAASYGTSDGAHATTAEGRTTDPYELHRRLRAVLWVHVLRTTPGLLLLPSDRLTATSATLCAWFGVPSAALSQYLLPPCTDAVAAMLPLTSSPLAPRSPSAHADLVSTRAAAALPSPSQAPAAAVAVPFASLLPQHHVVLLTRTSDWLQRAGYALWTWLGGAAAATAADVAAVLRAAPGLLYDCMTMRVGALVLHAALEGRVGRVQLFVGGDGGQWRMQPRTAAPDAPDAAAGESDGNGSLPAWVVAMSPPPCNDSDDGSASSAPQPVLSVAAPVLPAAAAALLLRYPAETLSASVLALLTPPLPSALPYGRTGGGGAGGAENNGGGGSASSDGQDDGGGGDDTRLGQGVLRLGRLLGLSRLAAAVLVLGTRGGAVEVVERLPLGAAEQIERAMTIVRRGGAWARELQRYLYGNTVAPGGGGGTGYGYYGNVGEGGESLEAVAAASHELLVVVQEWRRLGRLEALVAAGLREGISFTLALQMPEEEWRDVAQGLDLAR